MAAGSVRHQHVALLDQRSCSANLRSSSHRCDLLLHHIRQGGASFCALYDTSKRQEDGAMATSPVDFVFQRGNEDARVLHRCNPFTFIQEGGEKLWAGKSRGSEVMQTATLCGATVCFDSESNVLPVIDLVHRLSGSRVIISLLKWPPSWDESTSQL